MKNQSSTTHTGIRPLAIPVQAQRDIVASRQEWLRARLAEICTEYDDAALAVAEARAEQELGVPSFAMGVLQARWEACAAAVTAAQAAVMAAQAEFAALAILFGQPRHDQAA